jgi:hypothetical protein
MKTNLHRCNENSAASVLSALLFLLALPLANAQPTILSTVPANFATGVSPSAAVVFTFSESMDTANTSAQFISPPFSILTTTPAWSANNTILTCTPNPAFPANTNVVWSVTGQNPGGMSLSGSTGGFFMTGGGSGGGGISGTNAITILTADKLYFYQQTNSSPPADTNATHEFTAGVDLSSNLVVTAGTVTIPGASSPTALNQNASGPQNFSFIDYNNPDQTTFEQKYPEGNYVFNLTNKPANFQATVTLPTTMAQPNLPFITNYDAAQKINAAQPFTVSWGALQNGTSSDFIVLTINGSGATVFQTPSAGSNVLRGTVTSVIIPAGTFTDASTYSATLLFFRFLGVTNATYATVAVRASGTLFSMNTVGAISTPPGVSDPVWTSGGLAFDVTTSANQVLNVLFSTNCATPIAQWQKILTTNSPGTSVHIVVPKQPGTPGFVRLKNGP